MRLMTIALPLFLILGAPGMAQHAHSGSGGPGRPAPAETGQDAFAALAEIVALLRADPPTDWTRVNIAAVLDHLRDMNAVTLNAQARVRDTAQGAEFTVRGDPAVAAAIQRMTRAHAPVLQAEIGWQMRVTPSDSGAVVTVTAPDADGRAQIRALGFFGVMTLGAHHQSHHLGIARGLPVHSHN